MRVVGLLIAAACTSAGCDGVFGLIHIEEVTSVDAMPDGPPVCTTIVHDEDHDGIDDACDPCPFDANNPDSTASRARAIQIPLPPTCVCCSGASVPTIRSSS